MTGVRIVELAGIGPGPFAATILADLGADVLRIDRPGPQLLAGGEEDLLTRNRPSVEVDLKSEDGVAAVLDLVRKADLFIEGLRPGVTERLGLGPEACSAANPRLVYGRMTGWGQSGPLAQTAGHDITYTALSGVLHGLGQATDRPQFPINLLGDFGGGSTFLVIGLLAALHHARATGQGQVVDAAILDGTAYLDLMTAGWRAGGRHTEERGTNLLDGGAPFYRLYRTADARWMAVGALEPQFFRALSDILGLVDQMPPQDDSSRYDEMTMLLESAFASRTMAEWTAIFEGTDACVAPVLTPTEAAAHPHLAQRSTYVDMDGVVQPAPAPRFSQTPSIRSVGTKRELADALLRWQ
ncbi:CaiB/BaiF CoA-transferase family protein [Nocardioides sp. NPDC006273]|uniref:CaiB/BaiF CoA transferase family protein n=1 Tax=Nocardioides sp. NPDC006273 TaxID=3155598 RepID=UPI0033A50C5D